MDFTQNMAKAMQYFTTSGAFLTAAHDGQVNTMTVAWGFIGYIWGKPHFITIVRPQRHTQSIRSEAEGFTISIPFGTLRDELRICGTESGRDLDKATVVSFAPAKTLPNGVIVSGCDLYYECRTTVMEEMDENTLPPHIRNQFYSNDYHKVYIGEILDLYENTAVQ